MNDDTALLDRGAYDELLHGTETPTRKDKGPRRPRAHNPRLLGSRGHTEIPAKDERVRRNKRERHARKAARHA